jgi:RecA-family ATPase
MADGHDGGFYRCTDTIDVEEQLARVGMTDLRLSLAGHGYRPVPVAGPRMNVRSPGKQPVMDGWQQRCATAGDAAIRSWSDQSPGCTNTGVLTGISGGIGAADIDVLLPDAAAEIADLAIELLGATPLRRIGRAPKVLHVYRVADGFRKVRTPTFIMKDDSEAAVEFLAEGQQFVAFGIHPATDRPYQWLDQSPLDVPAGELPLVDLEAVETFIELAAQVLRNHGGMPKQPAGKGKAKATTATAGKPAAGGTAPIGDNFFANVNGAALVNPEPWVRQLFGAKARLHPGTGAYRVRSVDLGRELEEDISIHPSGAWDFGLEKPISPIDLVMQYGGAPDAKGAALWLCERLGAEPARLGWKSDSDAFRSSKGTGAGHRERDTEPPPDWEPDEPDAARGDAAADILAGFTNPTKLTGIEPPAREWIVEGWLPVGTVTSLYGAGGVGKTLLAQLLQTAASTGRPFLGLETTQCRVLSIFCEDDEDELHRRQVCINASMGIGMHDLGAVRWQSRFGKENVMATIEGGLLKATGFYKFVRAAAKQSGARLVIIDNIAQVFAGNENVRAEVTQFVNSLGTIAQEINGAVLLLGHPGKADNSEYSGSTAWDACVRSRWILERPKENLDDEDAGELADLRVLRRAKANYARKDDEITMRWEGGTFRTEGPARWKDTVDRIEERLQKKADDDAFLACLDALREQGRAVSHSRNAPTYAPAIMLKKEETKGISKRRLERAMERLFAAGTIKAGMEIGTKANRHRLVGIGRAEVAQQSAPESDFGCARVAPESAPESGAKCAEAAPESPPNPVTARVSELAPESAPESAPELRQSAPESSETCMDTAPECATMTPLYTTYIEGGTLGAVPPSNDDTAAAEEADRLHRVVSAADKLADLSARLDEFDWLKDFKPAPEHSGLTVGQVKRLRKVELVDEPA